MKKLLSLLIASLMISMTMSAAGAFAAADILSDETIISLMGDDSASRTIRVPISADVPLDGSSATSYGKTNIGTTPDMLFRRPQADKAYPTPLLFKTDFSGLELPEGKVIEKVEFFMYSISEQSGCTGYTADIDIYNASTDWEETTVVLQDWCDDKTDTADLMEPDILFHNPDDLYYADFTSTPDVSYSTTFAKIDAGSGNSELISFDITNAFKAAYPSGVIAEGDEFAWITDIRKCNAYRYMCIASKEHSNADLHPYLEITFVDKPELALKSYEIPVNTDDEFKLEISSNIYSASVTVNGEALASEDYEISGKTLIIKDIWQRLTTYRLQIEITDVYNQKLPKQAFDFTVALGGTKTEKANCTEAYVISKTGAQAITTSDAWTSAVDNSLAAIVYRFPIPEAENGANISSYEISYWSSYPNSVSGDKHGLYKWDKALGVDFASMTFNDLAHCVSGDNIHGVPTMVMADDAKYLYKIDVTDEVQKLAKEGETDACIILMPNTTIQSLKFHGSSGSYGAYCEYAVNDSNEILYYDKEVVVSGRELLDAKFFLTSSFNEDITSYVKLVRDYGTSKITDIQGVSFEYDAEESSITLSEAVTLDAGGMYTVVLVAGAGDKFSNILEKDLVLANIYASDAPGVTSVKIADSDFDDFENYESVVSKESVADCDSVKTICKINNKSDSDKNVLIFTLCYDSRGSLLDMAVSVVEAKAQTDAAYAGEAIDVSADTAYVKAFVWSTDYTVLSKAVVASR